MSANSSLLFTAAGEVRIDGRLSADDGVTIGPASMAIDAKDIILYVRDGGPGGKGKATIGIGDNSDIDATLYAAEGKVDIGADSDLRGALLGRRPTS